jgi:hypothetical protein
MVSADRKGTGSNHRHFGLLNKEVADDTIMPGLRFPDLSKRRMCEIDLGIDDVHSSRCVCMVVPLSPHRPGIILILMGVFLENVCCMLVADLGDPTKAPRLSPNNHPASSSRKRKE